MSQSTGKLSRRTLFAGATTVGAVATVVSLMPAAQQASMPAGQEPKAAPSKGGGYSLTEHVKRYYKTTLV
jgi:hypothetical protein